MEIQLTHPREEVIKRVRCFVDLSNFDFSHLSEEEAHERIRTYAYSSLMHELPAAYGEVLWDREEDDFLWGQTHMDAILRTADEWYFEGTVARAAQALEALCRAKSAVSPADDADSWKLFLRDAEQLGSKLLSGIPPECGFDQETYAEELFQAFAVLSDHFVPGGDRYVVTLGGMHARLPEDMYCRICARPAEYALITAFLRR